MSRRMPITPMTSPRGPRRAEALRVVAITSPEALWGLRRTLRETPCSTTSRRAAISSRASSRLTKRESDCSRTSSLRNPRSSETASFARRILRSEEHTSELQSLAYLVCRLLLEKKKKKKKIHYTHIHEYTSVRSHNDRSS